MAFGIICSGGDAPGMNPAVKKFVDYIYEKGETPYFIYSGFDGLIDGEIKKAEHKDVAGALHRGGSVIRSARSERFFDKKYRKIAYSNLEKYGINRLIVLGGDGSFRALDVMNREFDISFVGIPTTIDNDIYGTDTCLGVDTALNVIRDALDKIRDTASTFSRAFVVEVMGRNCGYLAMISAITSGAEICIIPEADFNWSVAKRKLLREIDGGRNYILAIVAEGSNMTKDMANWLESEIGIETRVTVLGHIQRGGSPTVADRLLGFEFIVKAIDYLMLNRDSNKIIVSRDGGYKFLDVDEVVSHKYTISSELLSMLNHLD